VSTVVPFFRPQIGTAEIAAARATLRSGWLAYGEQAGRFEERLAGTVGAAAALATSSGTAGLYLALRALGIGAGDEVITSAVTCIASVNAICVAGATPVLVDVCPDTLNLDPRRVAAAITARTAAILPVHYAGHPADTDALAALARPRGLAVIEDAAHALGATYRGRPVGGGGDATVFSFSATKLITTGEGGMVVGPPDLVERARRLACLGADRRGFVPGPARPASWADVVEPALKLAMGDLAASIGLAQLARLPDILARRRAIAARYTRALGPLPGVEVPTVRPDVEPSWHLYTLRVRPEILGIGRDRFLAEVLALGGTAAMQFKPAHHEPYLRERYPDAPAGLPVTERECARNLSLPMYQALTGRQVAAVVSAVIRAGRAAPGTGPAARKAARPHREPADAKEDRHDRHTAMPAAP
jgi:dTDP-4-amino-4,6-dideoxygalactose transaminase